MIQRVERIDDKLRLLSKPGLLCVDSVLIGKEDALILAAGFEDRVFGVLERMASSGGGGFKVIILNYKPFLEENKLNAISDFCQKLGVSTHVLTYDRRNPEGIGEEIMPLLKSVQGNIFIDVSAMSRLLIVQILVNLGKHGKFSKTEVLYSEARVYPPSKDEVETVNKEEKGDTFYRQMFLSFGVYREVTIVPELSSVVLQGQPIRLVTFPSFNVDQLTSLQGEIQPYYYNFIHGIPPLPENAWRPDAIKQLNHIDSIPRSKVKETSTSTLDYRETLDYLLKVYADHGAIERIVIAPIGSKMQTVAVGIFRTFMDDVHIVYPTPRKFSSPEKYTKGVKDIYQVSLDTFAAIV